MSDRPTCPHCGAAMLKWRTPAFTSWSAEWQWVCFNDECSYFVRGWEWMMERFAQHMSYRHRRDPVTGEQGPVPVWSRDALREDIIREED